MVWVRHGECNHCGWCCETLRREFLVRQPRESYWDEFYAARGFRPAGDGLVGRFGWVLAPCPQHVDGRCALGDGKPQRCADFPTLPMEIVATPCSYWFESEDGARVGGAGSPYSCGEAELLDLEGGLR